jgi:hypothetical protein
MYGRCLGKKSPHLQQNYDCMYVCKDSTYITNSTEKNYILNNDQILALR